MRTLIKKEWVISAIIITSYSSAFVSVQTINTRVALRQAECNVHKPSHCNTTTCHFRNIISTLPYHHGWSSTIRLQAASNNDNYNENETSDVSIINGKTIRSTSTSATTVMPRPDPSILISAQDDESQQNSIGFITVSLLIGTFICVQIFTLLQNILLPFPQFWNNIVYPFLLPIPLGVIFILTGLSHFVLKDVYTSIVPPKGTWGGLWNVPAPGMDLLGLTYQEYHAYWTGCAELGGGLLLVGCALGISWLDAVPNAVPAALLGLLVAVVTPSNVYMYTHDALMGGDGGDEMNIPRIPYPEGHYNRGIVQCILLSGFWQLTFH
mmetsp:Transcript_24573/g.28990  ORF Transcript_24573/g.28990 Transcript_24573/m.28990 type:complete len:324 (-) Transcript_24573:331-1302(-)